MTRLVIEAVWSETRGELEGVSDSPCHRDSERGDLRASLTRLVIETVWSETRGELEGVSVRIASDSPCHRDCLE